MDNLTNHGAKRLRKRMGINKSGIDKAFADALKNGKRQKDYKGTFRRYLDAKSLEHHTTPIVHGHNIYFVNVSGALVTVIHVPPKFKKYL